MSDPSGYPAFRADSRGNRLERWTAAQAQGGHVLRLRGPAEAVGQVCTAALTYQARALPAGEVIRGWNHVLFSPEPSVSPPVRQLLDLLREIVSVPSPQGIDFVLALDWYKVPIQGADPRAWPNTEAGELVYSGKYRYRQQAGPQEEAGRALSRLLCDAISRHALLRGARAILNIPGHDSTRVSFGSRLAATVARDTGKPIFKVRARSPYRPESKVGGAELAEVLENEFAVSQDVRSQPVLIVDDVIRSGASMAAVAMAARASGASQVLGICAARTMRR